MKVNDTWGYVDKSGNLAIAPQYYDAESFDGGIAIVVKKDETGTLRDQFINRKGKVLYLSSREVEYIRVD